MSLKVFSFIPNLCQTDLEQEEMRWDNRINVLLTALSFPAWRINTFLDGTFLFDRNLVFNWAFNFFFLREKSNPIQFIIRIFITLYQWASPINNSLSPYLYICMRHNICVCMESHRHIQRFATPLSFVQ